jgi:hypothetical protein
MHQPTVRLLSNTIIKPRTVGMLESVVALKQSSCLSPEKQWKRLPMQVMSSMVHQMDLFVNGPSADLL